MGRRIIFAAVVLALAAAGFALAAKGGGSEDVTLCAAKKSGALSLASKGKCGKGQRKLVIAKEGVPGAVGPQGVPGPAGPAGTTASIQPEAVHLVAPASTSEEFECAAGTATFCNNHLMNWANFGEGFAPAGFQKDAAGYVHLQGTVKAVMHPDVSGGGNLEAIFVLPPGYRPTDGRRGFSVPCGAGFFARTLALDVRPDGTVAADSQACESDGDPLSLDVVSFHP